MATSQDIAEQIRKLEAQQREAAQREAEEEAKRPLGLQDARAALERADRAAAAEKHTRGDNTAQVDALHQAVRALHAHAASQMTGKASSKSAKAAESDDADDAAEDNE